MKATRARSRIGVAVWIAAATLLASFGGVSPTAASGEVESIEESDLIQRGRLTICSSFPRLRFAEIDADGEQTGVDIDIGSEIAARLGLEPWVRDVPFEQLIDEVVGRGCDITIAGQFITAGRLQVIDMIPYRGGTPHVIVRASDPLAVEELVDLCGRSMAVVAGTVHMEIVLGVGDYAGRGIDDQCRAADLPTVDLREYPSQEEAEDALARAEVDAYSGNDFVVAERPDDFALSAALPETRNGIGHRKEAASLAGGVDAALDAMISDGSYLAILERYGVQHLAVGSAP